MVFGIWITRMLNLLLYLFLLIAGLNAQVKLQLKNTEGMPDKIQTFTTAPVEYEDLAIIKIPTNADIELDFSAHREGPAIGPDGGEVYKWGNGSYQWKMQNGGVLTYWNVGTWKWEKDGFVFNAQGSVPGNGNNFDIRFVDGSVLRRSYNPLLKDFQYFYRWPEKNLYYRLNPKGKAAPLKTIIGRFEFHYSEDYRPWIDAFTSGAALDRFFQHITALGLKSSERIPVLFFKSAKLNREFLNNPNAACSGGVGGIYGISFCNEKGGTPYFSKDTYAVSALQGIQHNHMIYHEWAHHLQQVMCDTVREGRKLPTEKRSPWFDEGWAEYFAYHGNSRHRGNQHLAFFENHILSGKPATLESGDPYLMGGQLFRYIAEKQGDKKLVELWQATCEGRSETELFRSLTGKTPQEWFAELQRVLKKQNSASAQTELRRAELEVWATDAFVLPFTAKNPSLPNLRSPSRVNLVSAFELNVAPLVGKLEGQFTTSRKERVYLFKNGTYSIEAPDYRVIVHANGTISAESGGYQVISWTNGAQQWTTPDGRKLNF